jgi:Na+-transporting NADH:ubiquinone oxidoreductase subunit F
MVPVPGCPRTNKEFYLCGSPAMIDACLILLRKKGVQDNAIFFDKFA